MLRLLSRATFTLEDLMAPPTIPLDARPCATCYTYNDDLAECTQCHGAFYCSPECQERDRPLHELLCKQFSETPNPEDGNAGGVFLGVNRRAIFFHPDEDKPRIVWINPGTEESALLQEGEGDPSQPHPEHNTFAPIRTCVLSPRSYMPKVPGSGVSSSVAFGDFYQKEEHETHLARQNLFNGLVIIARDGFASNGSTENKALAAAPRAKYDGTEPDFSLKGPFLFRRSHPIDGNIDLGDFRHLMRYLHMRPKLTVGVVEEGPDKGKVTQICVLKGCPNHPRCEH